MADKINIQQLESYLWNSAKYLRNKIDAGDYKGYIFPLMFLKRICDVYDDEYQIALRNSNNDEEYAKSRINHQFDIPYGYHWEDCRNASKNVGLKIAKTMRQIEKANPKILYGIFGDANWGNKDRLSDETMSDLIEHFSTLNLSPKNISGDLMGNAYEILIKKFADDSGHTAAEFYTNRTVVSLMTELLEPNPNESIYDPTCGTGGMLLECVTYLKKLKKDFRGLHLYGQEKNIITSDIARMNMLLHGFEDARIKRGDILSDPLFLSDDMLQRFDVILSNPPYSVNIWDRKKFANDPYGRNIYGTPPQNMADYAFIQHIIASMSINGRAAILLPHGVLFRDAEKKIRQKLIESNTLDAVIGLGPNLFYNSIMESCILIFQYKKHRKDQILFINALDQVKRIGTKNFLTLNHIKNISKLYKNYKTVDEQSYVASKKEISNNDFLLNIQLYVKKHPIIIPKLKNSVIEWKKSSDALQHLLTYNFQNEKDN